MVDAIHTAVPGRARFRVEGLYRCEPLKHRLESRLTSRAGVHTVSANPLTGNILVCFNSGATLESVAVLIESVVVQYHEHNSAGPAPSVSSTNGNGTSAQHSTVATPEPPTGTERRNLPPRPAHASPNGSQGKAQRTLPQPPSSPVWHALDADTIVHTFQTSPTEGLPFTVAQERLHTYGPNRLSEAEPRSMWEMLAEQVNSLPVALLTVAAGISVATGGIADAVIIMGVVAINATIGYVTESQSERTIHSLKNLVHPSAVVIRDQEAHEIPAEEVVPGDMLVLKPGSYIAADSRLIEAQHLTIDESTLTGESLSVHKTTTPLTSVPLPLADRLNMVYMGTLVTGGQGLAIVVETGARTEIGRIQALAGEAETPQTPMELQLDQMGRDLVLVSGAICGGVFAIGLLHGYGLLEMLKTAISLAVAAVPEGLPTVATTTLALGIVNMRKHHVLIRRLDAVETLGCVQAICLDKTGTLTLNRMSVVSVHTGMRRLRVVPGGFLSDNEPVEPLACEEIQRLAQVGVLCSETVIEQHEGQYIVHGSPTENALVHMAIQAELDILALRHARPVRTMQLRSENRNFMRAIHGTPHATSQDSDTYPLVTVKGSPSEVLAMCQWHLKDGRLQSLTESDRLAIETENERMAGEALRVLGAAYRESDELGTANETPDGLTWVGLIGMADPIRPEVDTVIRDFHHAGIDTMMITGDQSSTAYAIGKELALGRNGHLEILDSTHLDNVAPEVLTALSDKVQVFARVSPAHKLQIVQALQRAGKVVAMTGDGINDGPALKAANIGIAMGHSGTDVAREVADVVLEDDNLETMVVAISQGRTIYSNIRKSLHFLLTTNLSEIIVTASAISFGLGHPLNAMQLLWINLLSDIAPGLALALEEPEPDVLARPPRNPNDPIMKPADFRSITLESTALSAGALGAYGYGLARYGAGPQASTLAFTSLTTGQLLHAITSRSETHSVFDSPSLPPNPYLQWALLGSFGLQGLSLLVPGLRSLLGITPISLVDGIVIGASTALPFLANEATKKARSQATSGQTEKTLHGEEQRG
ncbi:MAG: HAD-IC family P-type ATPase [Candidatus Binatia bacterium]